MQGRKGNEGAAHGRKVAEYEYQFKVIDEAQKTFMVREMMPKDIKREILTGQRKFHEIMEKWRASSTTSPGSSRSVRLLQLMEPCEFGENCWCCYGHPRNSARVQRMARLAFLARRRVEAGTRRGKGDCGNKSCSNGVVGVSGCPDGGAEQFRDGHQLLEETVQAVTLVRCERVQQLTAEQIGKVPRDDAKCSATATGATVAKPVGDGETRLPEFAKDSATIAVPHR